MGLQVNGTSAERVNFNSQAVNYVVKDGKLVWADPRLTLSGPVGYTVVGSPTIVDGVASGFSANAYLTISNFSTSTPFEMVIRTKFNSFSGAAKYLFSFGGMYILQDSNTSIYSSIQKSDGTYVYPGFGSGLLPDTFYYLKLVYDGTTLWAGRSTDGTTYTETYNQNATLYNRTGNIYLAFRNSTTGTWDGSIDLKETYIKVNDQLWFYGKNYATQNIAPVPAGYTFGTTTTPSIGYVDMRTQQFTAAPSGATIGRDN